MTDFMSEIPNSKSDKKRNKRSKVEYHVYLALIFLTALPFCAAFWVYVLIRTGKPPAQGPIQTAMSEARTITPCIFWG
ncbi:cytochrome PufQ [Rhodobacteraceae bacterium]|nr:cytochrome PufQ [Paracoccaceae bacterium]